MNKRLPLLASFVLFLALCASAAYWGMQLFKPKQRDAAPAPAPSVQAEQPIDAAMTLFGGKAVHAQAASNYQLKGVVAASNPQRGYALLSADGGIPQAVAAGKPLLSADGKPLEHVVLQEVHAQYVMLNEGGVSKRLDLPAQAGAVQAMSGNSAPPPPPPPPPPQAHNGQPLQGMHGATGLNMPTMKIGEPQIMVNSGIGGPNVEAQQSIPKPAQPSEPNGPVVSK
ncbi:hypothetical protein V8J88_22950 [Massilia sp. W12]|uniref:hypothetical protein n=1 Tax=Massilia sp. W12 TaxID=3126507 RepID=UPI0030CD8584